MELTKSSWKLVLQESIDAIRTEVDKDMPISGIQILLAIPDKGAVSFREIERLTNLPHSSCSRGLALLAGISKVRITRFTPLVVFSDDPADRRVRYATLTDEGRAKVDKVYQSVATRVARVKGLM
jgi:DNA-binding MarR family transcriptional regulator